MELFNVTANKVFVNKIDLKATRHQIHDFFSKFGQVFHVNFKLDKNQFTGKGVVTFYQKEAAEWAVQVQSKA